MSGHFKLYFNKIRGALPLNSCLSGIIAMSKEYLVRRCQGCDSAAARLTLCCSQRCELRAALPMQQLSPLLLQSSAKTNTERKGDTWALRESERLGMTFYMLFKWQSPNLRLSELVQPQWCGTRCGGSHREHELPRSSWTGGGLVAWSPRCRRVRGSLPWWEE